MMNQTTPTPESQPRGRRLGIIAGAVELSGLLVLPEQVRGIVLLPQGIEVQEGTTPYQALAASDVFPQQQLGTLLLDLFNPDERQLDAQTSYFRNNTSIMEQRIRGAAEWLLQDAGTHNLGIGYLGIGVEATAALQAAAERPDVVKALVAVDAQLDDVRGSLADILAPTMLIAMQQDRAKASQEALALLKGEKQFEQLSETSSLAVGEDATTALARLAVSWFARHLEPIV